jgi:hypothetical protein
MAEGDPIALELMLNRFRRLVRDLQGGTITRNDFEPWEVDILLDIENCQLERGRRREETLQHYQRAVEQQLEIGTGPVGIESVPPARALWAWKHTGSNCWNFEEVLQWLSARGT